MVLRNGLLTVCVVLAVFVFSEVNSLQMIDRNKVSLVSKPGVYIRKTVGSSARFVLSGPPNAAAIDGSELTLSCQVEVGDTCQWYEYQTSPLGGLIFDGVDVRPGYPRYTMGGDAANGMYDLTINPLSIVDGGRYRCSDATTGDYAEAEVIFLDQTRSSCNHTIPANNVIILGTYYAITCILYYTSSDYISPSSVWDGPGDFNRGQANGTDINGEKILNSGASFIAQKAMDGKRFSVTVYFEDRYFNRPNGAPNTPTFTSTSYLPYMFLQYAPWNISYTPDKTSYEIGDRIDCNVDANPQATYRWINMQQSGNIITSQSLVLTSAMAGTTYTWRCEAVNTLGTQDIFKNVTVNAITTPAPTTQQPTTTPIPAVANCNNLSGKWVVTRTDGTQAELCLKVNVTLNGQMSGWLMNNTKLGSMITLVGATRNTIFDETGLVGIWADDTGVSALALECHNCYGVESLIANVVSRTQLDDTQCGDGGSLQNSEEYKFARTTYDLPGKGYCFAPPSS